MRKTAAVYLFVCITAGLGALVGLTITQSATLAQSEVLGGVLFLSILGVIAESQSLAIDENKAISIAFAIDISALLLFGLAPAVWVSFCTAFFSVMDFGRGHKEHVFNTPLHKSLFNASNYILSILVCGLAFERFGGVYLINSGISGIENTFLLIARELHAILAGLVVYVLVNTLMIMFYFLFTAGFKPGMFGEWFRIFRWSILSMFCIGTLGVFLTAVYYAFNFLAVLLFFAPFMLFRYAYVGFTSIQKGYLDTIKAFSAALEAKDKYTIGHAKRVEKYCEIIAGEMKLPSDRTKVLKYASLLHDIGKIGISETILNKEGKLTDEEYAEMKKHPVIGAQMLDGIQFLKQEVKIIRAHHVHYDGKGYPSDAQEEGGMLESQILCVADSFDAMTSDRAYRAAMSLEEAFDELHRYSGTQFSPAAVEALIRGLKKKQSKDDLKNFIRE
ncbi:MAG: HD-GYP domain-containing protein [Clostridiaceae bacterium]|nr:HD-GYP domain-containing protein [Clostridiaceae bacterium]